MRRWVIAAAGVVVLAVAAALVVILSDGTLERDIGSGVVARPVRDGQAVPDNIAAELAGAEVRLPFDTALLVPVSSIFRVGPSGALPSEVEFRFPLSTKVTASEDTLLVAMTAESDSEPWEPVLGRGPNGELTATPSTELSADGMTATLRTNHLSLFTFVRVSLGAVVRIVRDAAGAVVDAGRDVLTIAAETFHGLTADVFAEAKAPTCADEDGARAEGHTVLAADSRAVLWCFGLENGRRVVKVVNNRRYPLILNHGGMSVVDDGPTFRPRLSQLARVASGGGTVVFPREQVVFGVDLPDSGGTAILSTQFDGVAQSLYALETGVRLASALLTRFGGGSGVVVDGAVTAELPMLETMDRWLQRAECAATVTTGKTDFGTVLTRCATPAALLEQFGKKALIVAPVMAVAPVIAFFKSEFNALGDLFNGRDHDRITITKADVAASCPTGLANCSEIRQGDVDGDGRPDLVSLITNPVFGDCRHFQVRAVLASGGIAEGDLCFSQGQLLSSGQWQTSKFSFLGIGDVDGEPGAEVFAKLNYRTSVPFYTLGSWSTWNIRAVKFLAPAELIPLAVMDLGQVQSILYEAVLDGWYANGFTCQTNNGQASLLSWRIFVDRRNRHYTLSEDTLQRQGTDWRRVHNQQREIPYTDATEAKHAASERWKATCPGLGPLPEPDYYY